MTDDTRIEFRVHGISPDSRWLNPWTRTTLGRFLAENEGVDGNAIMADLVVYGRSTFGGGAAPYVTVRRSA